MTTTTEAWSPARVASIAPDGQVAAAGLTLSTRGSWTGVGHRGDLLWGRCQGSGKKSYQVCVDLSGPAFRCSCPSRKIPCKHVVGLMHLWSDGRAGEAEPADFVRQWAQRREARAAKAAARATGATADADDASPAGRRAGSQASTRREQRVTDGLDELDRWLTDQVEQGIATTSEGLPAALRRLAARMVDAQAPALALRLTELADAGDTAPDWARSLTAELGTVHLLVRAWQVREHLPADLVAAVHQQLGLSVRSETVRAEPEVAEHWVVADSQDRGEGRVVARHSWLYGRRTGRWARIVAYAREREDLPRTYTAGTQVEAGLHFYPGTSLRALSQQEYPSTGAVTGWSPVPLSIAGAREAWRDALAADPWADARPAIVVGRLATDDGGRLALADDTTMLPLTGGPDRHRRLALSAACDDAVVAGVLSPAGLQPLTLVTEGTVVPL